MGSGVGVRVREGRGLRITLGFGCGPGLGLRPSDVLVEDAARGGGGGGGGGASPFVTLTGTLALALLHHFRGRRTNRGTQWRAERERMWWQVRRTRSSSANPLSSPSIALTVSKSNTNCAKQQARSAGADAHSWRGRSCRTCGMVAAPLSSGGAVSVVSTFTAQRTREVVSRQAAPRAAGCRCGAHSGFCIASAAGAEGSRSLCRHLPVTILN